MNDFFEIVRFVGNAAWKVLPFFLLSMFLSVLINMLDLNESIRYRRRFHSMPDSPG